MSNISVSINTDKVSQQTDVAVLCKDAEITISNQGDYDSAKAILDTVKDRWKELEAQRKDIVEPLNEAKEKVQSLFKQPLELLKKAETFIKQQMTNYAIEQERKAREEQKRLQDIADAEAKRQQKILDEKIARAEASGKTEKVEELIEKKENVIPIIVPVIAPQIETPKGVSFKDNWKAIIIDANIVPREWCVPDEKSLNAFAKSSKGTKKIPGVEFKCEKILNSRG